MEMNNMNSMPGNNAPMSPQSKYKSVGLAIVLLFFLLAALLLLNAWQRKNAQPNVPEVTSTRTDAEAGKVVEGFPQDLQTKNASTTDSYMINYSDGSKLFASGFLAKASIKDVYDQYIKLLTDQKYAVLSKNLSADFANIYAINAKNQDVSVVISKQTGGTNVVVTYVQREQK